MYKTTIQVTILSEGKLPLEDMSLTEMDYVITDGDCVGDIKLVNQNEVDGPTMAQLLLEFGSEPGFFQLDEKGNELEV